MKGLVIKLMLDEKVLEKVELRDRLSGTDVRRTVNRGVESFPCAPESIDSPFLDTYHDVVASYDSHLLSNEELKLSVSSFLYD